MVTDVYSWLSLAVALRTDKTLTVTFKVLWSGKFSHVMKMYVYIC
jgi:hypothetical protein